MPFPSLKKVFTRTGTSSNFGQTRTPEIPVVLPTPAPTIKPTEEQKTTGKEESDDKATEQVDSSVKRQQGRATEADRQEGQTDTKGKGTTKNNEANTNNHTVATTSVSQIFSGFWNQEEYYTFRPIQFSKQATFLPNAMPLIEIMLECSGMVGRSAWIQKHESTYNEYAVLTGLCITFYLQILRAKKAASDLDGYENGLYNRFFKMHHEESIPIPQPFVAYFSTIVATQLEDPTNGQAYIQPQIPHMLALLASFGRTSRTDILTRVDDQSIYTPVDLDSATPVSLFDQNITFGAGPPDNRHLALAACGTAFPIRFYNSNYPDASAYIKDTNFFGPKGVNFFATAAFPGAPRTKDFSRLDLFLNLGKDVNPRWFDYLKGQMTIFSKHWKVQTNLSEIPTTGGLENTIICNLRTEINHATLPAINHRYATHTLNFATAADVTWYPAKFRNMTATFRTTRAGTERGEELQALTFGTNSLPPIISANIADYRSGPFFEHQTDVSQEFGKDTDHEGKEMFAGWKTSVFAPMFVAKIE